MNTYYSYFLEIKNRVLLSITSWLLLMVTCYFYKETLLFTIIDFSENSTTSALQSHFIFTNVTEIFYVYLNLTLFVSNQLVLLVIIYHITMFFSTGLYKFEFAKLSLTVQVFLIFWIASLLLLSKVIIPISWSFFLSFQESSELSHSVTLFFEAKIEEYLSYFINLYFVCLINCQFLAFIIFLLSNLVENLKRIKVLRKLFYLIFVIFSTLTTPPDIISQIVVSCFLITMYETFMFIYCLKLSAAAN